MQTKNHENLKVFLPALIFPTSIAFNPRAGCYVADIHEPAHTKHPLNHFSLFSLDGKTILLLLIMLTDLSSIKKYKTF